MKLYPRIFILWMGLCLGTQINAQKELILESVQVYSNILPNANYFHPDSNALRLLSNAFEKGVAEKLNLSLNKSTKPKLIVLNKLNQLGKINIDWSQSSNYPYHGYIELYEMDADFVFKNTFLDSIPQEKKDSIKSIWFLTTTIVNAQKEIKFKKTILLQIIPIKANGIGVALNFPATVPENQFKAIAKSIEVIASQEDLALLYGKAPYCYATDNFLMPYVQNTQRIKYDTTKKAIQYFNQGSNEMLRLPNAITQKVNLKNKSNTNPFASIIPQLKLKSESTDVYHLLQPLRDVKNNTDYHIETFIQINPRFYNNFSPISFINDSSFHALYENNTLLTNLKITESIPSNEYWFNTNVIYNGVDTTEKINVGTTLSKGKVSFEKAIEGKLSNIPFKILFNELSNTKMVYYNNELVMILDGAKLPFQSILIKKDLPNKLISLFTLMSFCEIFQSRPINE